ncbi:MAG: hypothetical protein FJ014_06930 [Chloroflexi bacterium]|nr:hypothetical protein [Chloroflexota bacterium]
MVKNKETADEEKTSTQTAEAPVYPASWDVFYQDAQGLECHLQLKGTTLDDVLKLANEASTAIVEAGGKPSRRMAGRTPTADSSNEGKGDGGANSGNGNGGAGATREPTYVDERGVRRCNRKLTDGTVCGRPVTEKEGRYGTFWSCPNYKAHARNAAR